jgi:hypothetical protein
MSIIIEKNSVAVFENFLPTKDFDALYEELNSYNFCWNFRVGMVSPEDNQPALDKIIYGGLEKLVYHETFKLFEPVLMKINPYAIIRMKVNLSTQTEKNIPFGWHTDFPSCTTMLMFFDDTNGHFEVEDGTKVECRKNTAVIFDSNLEHRGFSCTDSPKRIVLNMNYIQLPVLD